MNHRDLGGVSLAAHDPHNHDHVDCETCRIEQVEFDETLAELTSLAATPPPDALRGELLTAIRRVRPLPPLVARTVTATSTSISTPVSDLAAARARSESKRSRIIAALSLAVAAVMVVALSLGVWVHSLDQQHRDDVVASSTEDRLLSAPDVQIHRSSLNGVPVSYVVSRRLDQAMLVSSDLPDLGPSKVYQLWRITASGAQPAGLMSGGDRVQQWFHGSLEGASQLAITIERRGGVAQPTAAPRSSVVL